jgi:hypothetical protein
MDEKDLYNEENMKALLAASVQRPEPELKERLFVRLTEEQRRIYPGHEFPNLVLALMAAAILGLAVWAVVQISGMNVESSHPFLPVILLLLGLNLVWVPLASILIVKRRRIHG